MKTQSNTQTIVRGLPVRAFVKRVLTFALFAAVMMIPAAAVKINIYGTGAQGGGNGKQDPNYQLVSAPPTFTPTPPFQAYEAAYAAWLNPLPGLWWDIPNSTPTRAPKGRYVYRATFDLGTLDPTTAVLVGQAAADDIGEIWLNGTKVADIGSFLSLTPFRITDGQNGAHFHPGPNILDFVVYNVNDQSPTGLFVDISGTAYQVPRTGGTWKPVQTPFPSTGSFNGAGSTLLLTDGRVLVHQEQNNVTGWYTLTPDAYGDYAKGTWLTVAPMITMAGGSCYAPLAFASAVLPDGRVIVEGGEYNHPPGSCSWTTHTNKGAIYDPVLNTWTYVPPPVGWGTIGDAQSAVLPDGTFMLADSQSFNQAEMTAPYSGGASWAPTGLFKADRNDEEGWTLLPGPPDAEVLLTVDSSTPGSEMYVNGYWFPISMPVQLWDSTQHELGPAVLRPDGTVFQAGGTTKNSSGTGQSAIFDVNTRQWSQGPNFPLVAGKPTDIADGPAALMANGNVLMMASPGNGSAGASFFELQFGTNQLVQTSAPPNAPSDVAFYGHMLVLPSNQILFTDFSQDVEIYTPNDRRRDISWRPIIQHIAGFDVSTCPQDRFRLWVRCLILSSSTTYRLDGLQLNGMSQGAAYGDDYQSATNYPLIRVTELLTVANLCSTTGSCPGPRVYYCRTHDHNWMGVATGDLVVSTKFECPKIPKGFAGYLEVVTNGIASNSVAVTF